MKSFFSSLKYDFDKVYKLWCWFLSYKNHLCRFLTTYAVSIDGYVQKCYTKCKKSNGGETWVISNMASCIVDALIRNKVIDIQSTSVYQYGFEIFISSVLTILITITSGILFHCLTAAMVYYLCCFGPYVADITQRHTGSVILHLQL